MQLGQVRKLNFIFEGVKNISKYGKYSQYVSDKAGYDCIHLDTDYTYTPPNPWQILEGNRSK